MSYILDALQRADAERERGHVPGLNSQIVPPPRRPHTPRRSWPWVVAAVAGLCAGVAALLWWRGDPSTPAVEPVAVATAPSQESLPALPPPAPGSEPSMPLPSPASPPMPPAPILAPPRPEPAPAPPSRTAVAPPPTVEASAPARSPTASAAATAASAPNAESPVRSFGELSAEARAQLPQVSVSGATYSKDPALRMLIVNGKVVQEGQEISPGLKLETIGQRSAVLNHQGLRYSIGY